MPYIIETFDKPDSASVRAAARPAHLEFLAEHAKMLLVCGAKTDEDGKDLGGGFYILDTEDKKVAEGFIAADPFTKVELFARVSITRSRRAYINGECLL